MIYISWLMLNLLKIAWPSPFKLLVSNIWNTDSASEMIPGEAVEADLAELKRFDTDEAWKTITKLGKWSYYYKNNDKKN